MQPPFPCFKIDVWIEPMEENKTLCFAKHAIHIEFLIPLIIKDKLHEVMKDINIHEN